MAIDNQKTFDTVVAHLRKQGRKSESAEYGCRYRGPDGLKCSAGCLIPDAEYKPAFEGTGSSNIEFDWRAHGHSVAIITTLQNLHDGYEPSKWEQEFKGIADAYGLIYKPPTPLRKDDDR